jgi:L-ascorbate metabolism protein UlaG (beta-lactamase superfamily)
VQAVAAAVVLGARLLVPIHSGVVGAEGYSELPNPEIELLRAARRRSVAVEIARPGEWLTWKARLPVADRSEQERVGGG